MTDISQFLKRESRLQDPTDKQKAYRLRPGKRFGLGSEKVTRIHVAVVDVCGDWIEFNYEDKQGNVVGRAAALRTVDFRSLIVEELPDLKVDTSNAVFH